MGADYGKSDICVWVLSGSPEPKLPPTTDWIPSPDFVVAADGGAALAEMLGVTADLLVGDFDSIAPAVRDAYAANKVETRRYRHETKLETDTELAVLAALEKHPAHIRIFGALGGRVDHALANVMLLAHPTLVGVDARIIEGSSEIYLARPGAGVVVSGSVGDTVSVIPVGGDAVGVSNKGMEYPLQGETLPMGPARGVSNVLVAEEGEVRLEQGLLMVVVEHKAL